MIFTAKEDLYERGYLVTEDDVVIAWTKSRHHAARIADALTQAQSRVVCITGLQLRALGDGNIDVLIERDGVWFRVIRTHDCGLEGMISHITEVLGMERAPVDTEGT